MARISRPIKRSKIVSNSILEDPRASRIVSITKFHSTYKEVFDAYSYIEKFVGGDNTKFDLNKLASSVFSVSDLVSFTMVFHRDYGDASWISDNIGKETSKPLSSGSNISQFTKLDVGKSASDLWQQGDTTSKSTTKYLTDVAISVDDFDYILSLSKQHSDSSSLSDGLTKSTYKTTNSVGEYDDSLSTSTNKSLIDTWESLSAVQLSTNKSLFDTLSFFDSLELSVETTKPLEDFYTSIDGREYSLIKALVSNTLQVDGLAINSSVVFADGTKSFDERNIWSGKSLFDALSFFDSIDLSVETTKPLEDFYTSIDGQKYSLVKALISNTLQVDGLAINSSVVFADVTKSFDERNIWSGKNLNTETTHNDTISYFMAWSKLYSDTQIANDQILKSVAKLESDKVTSAELIGIGTQKPFNEVFRVDETKTLLFGKNPNDVTVVADSIVSFFVNFHLYDNNTAFELIAKNYSTTKTDSISFADFVDVFIGVVKDIFDTNFVADSLLFNHNKTLNDNEIISDLIMLSQAKQFAEYLIASDTNQKHIAKVGTELVSGIDNVSKDFINAKSENLIVPDPQQKHVDAPKLSIAYLYESEFKSLSKQAFDNYTFNENFSYYVDRLLTLTDLHSDIDVFSWNLSRQKANTLAWQDSATKALNKRAADITSFTDSSTKQYGSSKADSAIVTDLQQKVFNTNKQDTHFEFDDVMKAFNSSKADITSFTDSSTKQYDSSKVDSDVVTDSSTKQYDSSKVDSDVVTDSSTKQYDSSKVDSAIVTDLLQKFFNINRQDTHFEFDDVMKVINSSKVDSAIVTDLQQKLFNTNKQDTHFAFDGVMKVFNSSKAETITFGDALNLVLGISMLIEDATRMIDTLLKHVDYVLPRETVIVSDELNRTTTFNRSFYESIAGLDFRYFLVNKATQDSVASSDYLNIDRHFYRYINETVTAISNGHLYSQGYTEPGYFADGYVGDYRSF